MKKGFLMFVRIHLDARTRQQRPARRYPYNLFATGSRRLARNHALQGLDRKFKPLARTIETSRSVNGAQANAEIIQVGAEGVAVGGKPLLYLRARIGDDGECSGMRQPAVIRLQEFVDLALFVGDVLI